MRSIIFVAVVLAEGSVWAQADGGVGSRPSEDALFGTPQKSAPAPLPGTPEALAQADGGTAPSGSGSENRPSDDAIFGGGQTPQQGGTSEKRPSEDAMFGGGGEANPATTGTQPPAASAAEKVHEGDEHAEPSQEEQGLNGSITDQFKEGGQVEDPLQIGGLYYQQMVATNRGNSSFAATTLSVPTIVDAYLDARPSDRLRAMVVGRLRYDATFDEKAVQAQTLGQTRTNPSVTLDQLWLSFDVMRTVFVTAGRQHVKWGTGRFWNPTDYLHATRRNALALFDDRTGTDMIKLHVPVEKNGMNFYGIALLNNTKQIGTLGSIGGAARGEMVIGDAEVGLDAIVQNGNRPRYGADVSAAVGPFDVYGEVALKAGPALRYEPADFSPPGFTLYEKKQVADYGFSGTGGFNYTFAYRENDTATIGAEYFYNPNGYDDPKVYPYLLLAGAFQPFYLGQHYASLYVLLPGPGDWDKTSFVLSNLANLSDRSFVSRLDFTVRVLSFLTVEANVSAYYGNPDGEFRLRLTVPGALLGRPDDFVVPEQRFSAGVALRMAI